MVLLALSATAFAQTPQPPPDIEPRVSRTQQAEVVRIGQDYTLEAGEEVREVAVVFGDATIHGTVDRDVVVVFGTATVTGTGSIGGDFVVVGGSSTIAEGATVGGDFVVVGGSAEAPPGFKPGGDHVVVNPPVIGNRLSDFFPWITRGLLWGRLIVPDLTWIWFAVGAFFLLYVTINALADAPVRASAGVLVERPVTAFGVGLLVFLLWGPVNALLAVSVVGIAVIPFLSCAMLLAGFVGRVAAIRWIGMRLKGDPEVATGGAALVTFVIGFALLTLIYMVPVLGIVTWAVVGTLGLGAATLAIVEYWKREHPPAPVPPPPVYPGGGAPDRFRDAPGGAPDLKVGPTTGPPMAADVAGLDVGPTFRSGEAGTADAGPAFRPGESAYGPPGTGGAPPAPPVTNGTALPLASFRDRFFAGLLDLILVAFVVQLLDFRNPQRIVLLLWLAYTTAFWAWKRTSVGGIICQLRIVRADGQPFTFADALVRGLGSIFSLVVVGLGYLWILRDPERQAWHDKIAGTYVVKVPRNYPL
jgi:uncharacterized RDD family membrane protein YckC